MLLRAPDNGGPVAAPALGAGELFQVLRDGTARTKSELAALTGLSRGTVAARLEALRASNLVHAAGAASSSGGRPPAQLAFNPRGGCVLAIDLGASHATLAVTDLMAQVLETHTMRTAIADGPGIVLERVFAAARELLRVHASGMPLLGVGVGVPGPVDHDSGRPDHPPIMPGWDRYDIRGRAEDAFGVPCLVDNDVNLLALGEHAVSWPEATDLVFVKVATGIGAGIIMGGQIQRGARGAAGDIGHVQVPKNRDSPRDADDDRDLEAIASGTAIAARLRAGGIPAESSADVVALVRAGNAAAIEETRQAGREVGEVIATVVNLLNPSVVVLGGSVGRVGEHMLAGIREVVYRRSIPLATQNLSIVATSSGETAGVLGAAIMVTQSVLAPASVNAIVSATAPV
jgi:predicted NBD/HSP70 family sugar kinase